MALLVRPLTRLLPCRVDLEQRNAAVAHDLCGHMSVVHRSNLLLKPMAHDDVNADLFLLRGPLLLNHLDTLNRARFRLEKTFRVLEHALGLANDSKLAVEVFVDLSERLLEKGNVRQGVFGVEVLLKELSKLKVDRAMG